MHYRFLQDVEAVVLFLDRPWSIQTGDAGLTYFGAGTGAILRQPIAAQIRGFAGNLP
jgi:hypothetical protein